MKGISESKPAILKAAVCKGEQDAIRALTSYYFAEIWANMLLGNMDEQADALISLEIDLQRDVQDFCKSKEPVDEYLRKQWKKKLVGFRKRMLSFDGDYMGGQEMESQQKDTSNPNFDPNNFSYRYFISSLGPVLRMLFETKYMLGLNGKNGLFQVSHFLLNAAVAGHPMLSDTLKEVDDLYEPLIADFLIRKAKAAFTNQVSDHSENIDHLLQNLPAKRIVLKKAFHRYDMKIFRSLNQFKTKLANIKELSSLEQAFILINDYLKIEDSIEFWVQLNIDSQQHPGLQKELSNVQLADDRILKKHLHWRRKAIIKNISLKKNHIESITKTIQDLQYNINQQLNQNIHWKTN